MLKKHQYSKNGHRKIKEFFGYFHERVEFKGIQVGKKVKKKLRNCKNIDNLKKFRYAI